MKWKGRRGSTNVTDARGRRVARGAGAAGLVNLALRLFGVKGLLVIAAVGIVAWQMGLIDPAALLSGNQMQEVEYQATPEEDELLEFVKVVLADTEDIWTREFDRVGQQYREPELIIYRSQHPTGCGMGDARMGPFYCPADKKIYIDLGFYDDLARQFEQFAQALGRVSIFTRGEDKVALAVLNHLVFLRELVPVCQVVQQ